MPRNSRVKAFKNTAIFRGLTSAAAVGARLSLPRARSIGRKLGWLAYRSVRRERAKAMKHLAFAMPHLDEAARDEIVRKMFLHLGTSLLEICWLPNMTREVLEKTTTFEGLENLAQAMSLGRGAVLFTGHTGNWEWLGAAVGLLGYNMNVVARELYDSRINDFIVTSRLRHGVQSIGRGSVSAAREILQTLRSGAALGVLIDQSIKAENADIDFFGHPAPTPIGAAKLAIRAGATCMACFIERRGDMQHIRFETPIPTTRGDDPVELTARITHSIEAQIRRVPEQWVWMHDRWRRR